MSTVSICSKHRTPRPGCKLCNVVIPPENINLTRSVLAIDIEEHLTEFDAIIRDAEMLALEGRLRLGAMVVFQKVMQRLLEVQRARYSRIRRLKKIASMQSRRSGGSHPIEELDLLELAEALENIKGNPHRVNDGQQTETSPQAVQEEGQTPDL